MANNQKNDKTQYFNVQAFVKKVMDDCELGDIDALLRNELEDQIERRLGERITASIINSLTDEAMAEYEKLLKDNTDLDDLDALTVVASKIPGLAEKILKAVNDLYEELTYDARRIQKAIDEREKDEKAKI